MEQNEQSLSHKERQETKREEKLNKQMEEKNKKKMQSAILWTVITVFVVGTIGAMIALASKKSGPQFAGGTVKPADASDWVKGAPLAEATVVLTEYSDFQCPACGAYYPMVKQLGKEFKNLAIVYRHFPLPQHDNARPAAQAAEAAGKQGKFWEMHDMLFENQEFWSVSPNPEEAFNTYAEKLGLDMEKFKTDVKSATAKTKITSDYQSGASEVDGTPSFFLNNQKIKNPRTYEEFRNIIQQAGGAL